ncbi:hypothetical protein CB0940_02738 [Cercospora beticola]|uniref:Uncharacterized protein n=1 Tax=Cercospora beticola TaxID=122368 RepID=A0A2G5I3R2_CERBT|nr:hypothetical protein CB0940_02738 [Cercospora beticola]PIA99132.1 hypothetical protein CB0940_02738 [Cercospora beticola]
MDTSHRMDHLHLRDGHSWHRAILRMDDRRQVGATWEGARGCDLRILDHCSAGRDAMLREKLAGDVLQHRSRKHCTQPANHQISLTVSSSDAKANEESPLGSMELACDIVTAVALLKAAVSDQNGGLNTARVLLHDHEQHASDSTVIIPVADSCSKRREHSHGLVSMKT